MIVSLALNRHICNEVSHFYSYSHAHTNTNTHHMSNARQLKFFNCQLKAKLIKLSKRAETCN